MVWRRLLSVTTRALFLGIGAGLFLGLSFAHAQSGGRSQWAISTGGGASALGPPTTALYTNPAHLGTGRPDATLEVRLFDLRAYTGGDLLQFDRYSKTFGGKSGTLTDAEESQVLDRWFRGGRRDIDTYTEVAPLSVAYRPKGSQWAFGVGVRARALSEVEVNRGLFDLFLVGADSNRTVAVDGRYLGLSTTDLTVSLSYSFESVPLTVGASPRLIFGTHYADGRLDSDVTIRDSLLTHRFKYKARAAGALSRDVYDTFNAFGAEPTRGVSPTFSGKVSGLGAGIDLGAVYEVQPEFFVSMSVTDLGGIQWNRDAQTVTPVDSIFRFDGFELNRDRLQNEFDGDVLAYAEHQADSLARAAYEEVNRDRSSFSVGLPTALHVNGTWSQGALTLNGGATLGLSSESGAVAASPVVHLGGEVRLGPIPVRAGVRLGGPQAVTLGGGFGVHVGRFQFDLGISATPNTTTLGSGGRYALGLSMATIQF